MILVDSGVWIDHINDVENPHTRKLAELLEQGAELGLADLVLMEVLQGIRAEDKVDTVLQAFASFPVFETGGMERCVAAARNYRTLRRMGVTVRKQIDILIATFCIEEDLALLHHDRDFDPMQKHLGLRVVPANG